MFVSICAGWIKKMKLVYRQGFLWITWHLLFNPSHVWQLCFSGLRRSVFIYFSVWEYKLGLENRIPLMLLCGSVVLNLDLINLFISIKTFLYLSSQAMQYNTHLSTRHLLNKAINSCFYEVLNNANGSYIQ